MCLGLTTEDYVNRAVECFFGANLRKLDMKVRFCNANSAIRDGFMWQQLFRRQILDFTAQSRSRKVRSETPHVHTVYQSTPSIRKKFSFENDTPIVHDQNGHHKQSIVA